MYKVVPLVQNNSDSNRPDLENDLIAIDHVLMRAFETTTRLELIRRYLASEPHGWVMIRDEQDKIVGTGYSVTYPDAGFGWIGNIATLPEYQKQGIGNLATQWCIDYLTQRKCASVLDASKFGAPIYTRMGFQDFGTSRILFHNGQTQPKPSASVREMAESDLAQVYRFDHERFGADRSRILKYMFDIYPRRSFVEYEGSEVVGYGIAQSGAIGPFVADSLQSTQNLLAALLACPYEIPPRIALDADSEHRQAVYESGFTLFRELTRQHLGIGRLPGKRKSLCGQVSLGEG